MLARRARFRCVALITLLAAAVNCLGQSIPLPDRGSIGEAGTGTIPLIGPWRFQTGDDPTWSSLSFDDSGWKTIEADRPWGQQGYRRYTGYAWYRICVSFPRAAGVSEYLLVPHVQDVYQVFWNGVSIGEDGKMPPWPVWHVSEQPKVFRIGRIQGGVLAVRVWKAPLFSDDSGSLGGFAGTPIVGDAVSIAAAKASIDYEWLRGRQLEFGEQLIYGLIALFGCLVWWRNRGQWVLLWMACYAITPLIGVLLLDAHIAIPYSLAMGLTQPVNCVHDISLWLLLLWLLHLNEDQNVSHAVKFLAIASLTLCTFDGILLSLAWNPRWLVVVQSMDAAITAVSTVIQILPLVLVVIAIRRRTRLEAASWIVAALTFLDGMLVSIQQGLKQGQRFTGWTIGNELENPLFSIGGNSVSLVMISRGLLLIAIVAAVYISYREERRSEMILANEFSSARELQRMLIPENQHHLPGFVISSAYHPALEVGGDFFQLIPVDGDPDGSTLLLLGDVSGHGLKAALSVSYVIGIVRVLAEFYPQPGPLLTELNHRLCGHMENGFVTCIAARINRLGACCLSSAGHPPPFLNWRSLEVPGALPLGLDVAARYDQLALRLEPGDHLALYTDGLLEARNKAGELYGFDRLQKLFAANPTAAEAAEVAVQFGQDDDVTVVTLAYVGEGTETPDENGVTHELVRQ